MSPPRWADAVHSQSVPRDIQIFDCADTAPIRHTSASCESLYVGVGEFHRRAQPIEVERLLSPADPPRTRSSGGGLAHRATGGRRNATRSARPTSPNTRVRTSSRIAIHAASASKTRQGRSPISSDLSRLAGARHRGSQEVRNSAGERQARLDSRSENGQRVARPAPKHVRIAVRSIPIGRELLEFPIAESLQRLREIRSSPCNWCDGSAAANG